MAVKERAGLRRVPSRERAWEKICLFSAGAEQEQTRGVLVVAMRGPPSEVQVPNVKHELRRMSQRTHAIKNQGGCEVDIEIIVLYVA